MNTLAIVKHVYINIFVSGAETVIFLNNRMTDDAQVHGFVKASAAMVFTMQEKYVSSQNTSLVLPRIYTQKLRQLAKYTYT